MKIGLDVDDVIADLHPVWIDKINETYGTTHSPDDIVQWNFAADLGLTNDQIYKCLVPELYKDVQPCPGALDVVNELRRSGHEIVYITSCPDVNHWLAKSDWLVRHGFLLVGDKAFPVGRWATYHTKRGVGKIHGVPLLVDDSIKNCQDWAGMALLLTRGHNRAELYEGKRLKKLSDLLLEVKYMPKSSTASEVQTTVAYAADDKPTNPKDAISVDKLPLHLWPETATVQGTLAMLEGALKYGRSNFRAIGVRSSVYVAAAKRHLNAWFEGEDRAPDSDIDHLGHVLACVAILIDAREAGKLNDDRQVAGGYNAMVQRLTPEVKRLHEKYKDRSPKHYSREDVV